ncbi:MAG: adenylosuccinate lyase [Saprospiraceae bacterium]|nr:adenylosuccinate lyase [Saprospiraceae bacterium]
MLQAISPVDGRYAGKTKALIPYFSEFALIRARVRIEIEYLIALADLNLDQLAPFDQATKARLLAIHRDFSEADARVVKDIEATTNHDVKAVEYFLKDRMEAIGLGAQKEWVHFALTSQDVNNTATPLLLQDAMQSVILPAAIRVNAMLMELARSWHGVPMLAHTHGQPASPTTVGKELRVFIERIDAQLSTLGSQSYYGKFGGATGNFNAHKVAYPQIDWRAFGDRLMNALRLERIQTTTQIDHYDHLAEVMHAMIRLSTILVDLCRDIWSYISMDYFRQNIVAGEVGSSTMPHKVNPIDFENAEGNLGVAIALFNHLAIKLPVSRLQRDLTDSTVLRNLGVPFAHFLIAAGSIDKGLRKLELNRARLDADLERNWIVTAEAIQTILRREGVPQPYELLKQLTRGKGNVDQKAMFAFIEGLDISEDVKRELKEITPFNYVGYA